MTETERDERIGIAYRQHEERCRETEAALQAAAEAHAKIHGPSLERYQAEYAEIWQEYNEQKDSRD